MRKGLIAAFAALCALASSAGAQTVLDTHPAQDYGKDFTMKDVTVSRTGYAASFAAQWNDAGSYLFRDGNGVKVSTIAGELSDYEPSADRARLAVPRGASNVTPSGKGAYAFTEGHSLFCINTSSRNILIKAFKVFGKKSPK